MVVVNQITPITFPDLPANTSLTGDELVALSQANTSVKATLSSLPAGFDAGVIVYGDSGGAPFPNFRTLKAGDGVDISDAGAQGDLTISLTAGSGNAPANAPYVVMSATSALSQERILAVSSSLSLTDGGANGNVTIGTQALSGAVTSAANSLITALSPGVDATKIADGSVDNTEFQYLDGVTSNIQTQLDGKQPTGSYLTSVTADSPLSGSGTSGSHLVISQATTSTSGYLSSTDWNTFNNKGSGTVTSVSGTSNRITSTGGNTPVIDIDAAYVGQSSITTLGTVATGTWDATTIAVNKGGTGQTSYTNGQLLIGNTTGNTLDKATLTGTSNQVIVTNGGGSITLSTPQDIATTSTPTFSQMNISGAISTTSWGTAGIAYKNISSTYTDTASSGTVANAAINALAASTLAASTTTTFTNAQTLYISGPPAAGSNVTITRPWALQIASGNCQLVGQMAIGGVVPTARLHMAGNLTQTAWTTGGIALRIDAGTWTDSSSSGTVASICCNGLGRPTFAASSSTTYTDGATLYIANSPANGSNVTVTTPWSIWVDAGNCRFDGSINLTSNNAIVMTNQVSGAGAGGGTLLNAPAAGNPTFWVPINVNGVAGFFPVW